MLSSIIGSLAVAVRRGLSPGDVAALRRLEPGGPAHPAFWKVCAGWLDGSLPPEGPARTDEEEARRHLARSYYQHHTERGETE